MPVRKILKFGAICLVPVLVAAAWIHNVSTAPTDDDTKYIHAMLEERGVRELVLQGASTFDEEIRTIVAVQDAVLARAPEDKGLPLGSEREPRLLYEARYGLCYDRSRAIEKALTLLGFGGSAPGRLRYRQYRIGRGEPAYARDRFSRSHRSAYLSGVVDRRFQRALDFARFRQSSLERSRPETCGRRAIVDAALERDQPRANERHIS